MSELIREYAEMVLPKETFLHNVRTIIEGVLAHVPEMKDIWQSEALDRCMVLYEEAYPDYVDATIKTIQEVYTEEQVQTLYDFYTANPWAYESSGRCLEITQQNCFALDQSIMEKVPSIIESFLEEKEGENEVE